MRKRVGEIQAKETWLLTTEWIRKTPQFFSNTTPPTIVGLVGDEKREKALKGRESCATNRKSKNGN